jgi:hypothetical protein
MLEVSSMQRVKRGGLVERKSRAARVRKTLYLSPETAEKLRRHCITNDIEQSDLAEELLMEFFERLARRTPKPPSGDGLRSPPRSKARRRARATSSAAARGALGTSSIRRR